MLFSRFSIHKHTHTLININQSLDVLFILHLKSCDLKLISIAEGTAKFAILLKMWPIFISFSPFILG